jgi:putative transposase
MRQLRRNLLDSGARYFHCVSRVAGREFLFGNGEREVFRAILRKVEAFSGVQVLTWTILSNHFHVLVEIPDAPDPEMPDEELLARLSKLYSRVYVRDVGDQLRNFSQPGMEEAKKVLRASYIRRMGNLSEFMRSLKQRFSSAYNRHHGRRGTLWEERFRATAVGGNLESVLTVAAYIDLNAVRAGLCNDPKDYRWCGYAEAVAGDRAARTGLAAVLESYGDSGHWAHAGHVYRRVLFGLGEEKESKRGFDQATVDAELNRDGKLGRVALLRCRVRYFSDGLAIGTRVFVEEFFQATKGKLFTEGRRTGARKMRGGNWGDMFSARDLQRDPVKPP